MRHGDACFWEVIMKKFGLSSLVAGLLMANVAGAEPVAVKDGAIFIVSGGKLSVQAVDPVAAPLPALCELAKTPELVPNATDVAINDNKAFVTITDPVTKEVSSVESFDVSECLSSYCDAEPVVNLNNGHKGELFIPCLEVNGKRYDITMEQRGSSMNWEVVGFPDSEHHHGHDDDHDDDHKH
jgi:hypothetical protein